MNAALSVRAFKYQRAPSTTIEQTGPCREIYLEVASGHEKSQENLKSLQAALIAIQSGVFSFSEPLPGIYR